ncbi:single-stranded-DNA-specific exonuclease RecJ [Desulfotomaculum copahuensis]|uniref:Single-stranded-DNA-specific exonuclease RecJ n=1 Tax=Desulfotomaculum copahuensis TaxID=1838280 RepID=A0A1B7LGG6_9FIRM|nr:single-stranded-DNA-specific exonuclease RecJ [Desulfotomaculum copahuensis]OAT85026.1 single-stranded-DNA-specific exonuclease RecJ [Desulfotomaculum copahuensis]
MPLRKQKIWRVKRADPALKYILARELKISPILAHLLLNRGVYTVEEARIFLSGGLEQLAAPGLMKGMDRAVERLAAAIKSGDKVLVYGDYDADGITATALLVKVLRRLGARVEYYIPGRLTEGYGLHEAVLEQARAAGFTLVVTVDCGISNAGAVAAAVRAGGPDVIITDHHQVPSALPPAVAVLNPRQPDCAYPFKELAGVGVALKLAQALLVACGQDEDAWQDYLDLACLGTVADIVPLLGENRILVKAGLSRLACGGSAGLQALLDASGVKKEELDARAVGFALAPRLNAAGRLGDARPAVELLLCTDDTRARELAGRLNHGNRERQQIEAGVLAEALAMLHADPARAGDRVLVLASPGWHAGVIGIVASRLMDHFYRPVLLIALDGGQGKGSGRSIPGFHLYRALEHCREYLLAFGGHAGAAGFSLPAERVEALRAAINRYAGEVMPGEAPLPVLDVDALVSLRDISPRLITELAMLAPFGHGNPDPLLACCGVSVLHCRGVGRDGHHLKLLVRENGTTMDGIGFHLAGCVDEVAAGAAMDLAFTPAFDHWRGERNLQLAVKDLRPGGGEPAALNQPHGGAGGPGPKKANDDLSLLFQEAARHLPRAEQALFLPGFVRRALAEYSRSPQADRLPDWCRRAFGVPPPAAGGLSGTDAGRETAALRLVDRRGRPGRPAWLAGLVAAGRRTLVLVDSPHRTVELASYLRHACPEAGKGTVFCHAWQDEGQRVLIRELLASGRAGVLVTTPDQAAVTAGREMSRVVVYHPPGDRREWEMVVEAARRAGAGAVYLLFGREDARLAARYLAALAPDRDSLARLYLLLSRGNGPPARSGSGDELLDRLTRQLKRAGCVQAQEFTVALGMAVLAELGLLAWPAAGGDSPVCLPACRGEKRPLSGSATYCWAQQLKKTSLEWLGHTLNASVGTLFPGPC